VEVEVFGLVLFELDPLSLEELLPEPEGVLPPFPELVAEPDVVPAMEPDSAAGVAAGPEPPRCEASKPRRRTNAEIVLRIQKEMRLTVSPAERLEMEPVLGEAGAEQGVPDQRGPDLGAADEDVALGDVGHPVAQRVEVVDTVVDAHRQP
jgi:hypothetical protein